MKLTILDDIWTCPRCNKENKVVIEHAEKDRIKCIQCAVYFHRSGWTYYFESADGHRLCLYAAVFAQID